MKKYISMFLFILFSMILFGCNSSEMNNEVFAVVQYDNSLWSSNNGKIIFGTSSFSNSSAVYFYNEKKNSIQLQPSKSGNIISNIDAEWQKIYSIESIGLQQVYYLNNVTSKYELINENEIEVYKITIHTEVFSTIIINEIFVIRVEDISAFEFNYEVEELKDR